jgi:transglutaminase-like putative cysteine protease
MTNMDQSPPGERTESSRVVTCDIAYQVSEPSELILQVVASSSAGRVAESRFVILVDGGPPPSLVAVAGTEGTTMQIVRADPGRLTLSYRARIVVDATGPDPARANAEPGGPEGVRQYSDYESQVYLRPSRYCPSDHLVGFAVAEFGTGPDVGSRIAAISSWIRRRIEYVPGSSTVHDSAEDTLLTGMGTCRDFAHLGIALCRATGIPARFTAVYAPGLSPMEFHAVFEARDAGRWWVHDSTGLAPRSSLVRIATGRDAADAAFADVTSGSAELEEFDVTATAEPYVADDDGSALVELS